MTAGAHTAAAAAVMDRLTRAGLGEAAMPGWWRTPRRELGWLPPEDALNLDQGRVLALADTDADQFRTERGGAS